MEKQLRGWPGWPMVALLCVGIVLGIAGLVFAARGSDPRAVIAWVLFLGLEAFAFTGLSVVNPNEVRVDPVVNTGTLYQ